MNLESISMARLIVNDCVGNSQELQGDYGRILWRKLNKQLTSQAVMAGALGNSARMSVGQKEGWFYKSLSYLAGALILRMLLAIEIGAMITAALTLFPFIAVATPVVISFLGTTIVTGVYGLLTSLSKNRAKISAKAFMGNKPSDEMLKMVSDLVVLFNVDKFQLIYSRSKESSLWDKIQEPFHRLHRRLTKIKAPKNKQDREIRKFLKKESKKIWKIFTDCTHNPGKYELYKSDPLAEKILEFFESKFELDEPDIEKSRQLEINVLWLTVFAQYLTKNNPELIGASDSIDKILNKLNTIFSHHVDPERLDKHRARESRSADSLNERMQRLEALYKERIDILRGELAKQSTLIGRLQSEVQHLREESRIVAGSQRAHREVDEIPLLRTRSCASINFFSIRKTCGEALVPSAKPVL
ncbi:hypothetical protein RVIR1_13410 [Candidatus Rickettsiella viridis]|uniref:Uncharacterized protein n=1 Tax=Candidatus Rickettsiella viridis TaxID=676208 RepID=A0A2Z5UWA5_9COXI|nr:hypothetical protein [Candidatus Rickettsiella viridis]BBB15788.1 hypothetical protein RVIR1_13410 [Candidatus Rickettsiella viridis]